MSGFILKEFKWALLQIIKVSIHVIVLAFILSGMRAVQVVMEFYWGSHPVLLSGMGIFEIKMEWIINFMDIVIFLSLLAKLIIEFFKGKEEHSC